MKQQLPALLGLSCEMDSKNCSSCFTVSSWFKVITWAWEGLKMGHRYGMVWLNLNLHWSNLPMDDRKTTWSSHRPNKTKHSQQCIRIKCLESSAFDTTPSCCTKLLALIRINWTQEDVQQNLKTGWMHQHHHQRHYHHYCHRRHHHLYLHHPHVIMIVMIVMIVMIAMIVITYRTITSILVWQHWLILLPSVVLCHVGVLLFLSPPKMIVVQVPPITCWYFIELYLLSTAMRPAAFSASVQTALLPGFEKHNMQWWQRHAKPSNIPRKGHVAIPSV